MEKKIIWLVVSGLMVLSLLAASCAGEVTKKTEVTPPTKEVTPAPKEVAPAEKAGMVKLSLKKLDGTPVEKWVEAPKYGGTFVRAQNLPDISWDTLFAAQSGVTNLELATSELLQGNWTRGPAGTEETTWWNREWFLELETGDLAESWEVPDPETIIYHIRKGVRWQDKPPLNGRELTANDVAFELTRQLSSTKSDVGRRIGIGFWFISATAVDKYTVVVKGKEQKAGIREVFRRLSEGLYMIPPEVIQKYGDMRDWRNVVGTGPFILVDNIEGSAATFKRNPNYWKKDPLFPKNQLPYVDTVKVLLIEDASTQYAALRTGKVNYLTKVSWENAEQLLKTNPGLGFSKEITNEGVTLSLRSDTKPFTDIRVRRALAMAIDRPAILRDYYRGNAQLLGFPVPEVPDFKSLYVPLEQLPESSRELYQYNPDKAKQLLAEAGYPQGFKFTAVMYKDQVDMASIFKAYLAKVGVDIALDLREYVVYNSIARKWPKEYKEAVFGDRVIDPVWDGGGMFPGSGQNYAVLDDPFINERRLKMLSFELMQNQAEQDRLAKELSLYLISQSYYIAPPASYVYEMWSPWVKNFYGMNMGNGDRNGSVEFLWVD